MPEPVTAPTTEIFCAMLNAGGDPEVYVLTVPRHRRDDADWIKSRLTDALFQGPMLFFETGTYFNRARCFTYSLTDSDLA